MRCVRVSNCIWVCESVWGVWACVGSEYGCVSMGCV